MPCLKMMKVKAYLFLILMAPCSIGASKTYLNFSDKLGYLESKNNYKAVNRFGYLGKYQFGHLALVDLKYKTKSGKWLCKDSICSKEDFLNNKKVQEKALKSWVVIQKRYLKRKNALKYIGKTFKGIKITEWGLIAASHLVGAGAVSKMLRTKRIPKDGNGVKATTYLKHFQKD